MATAGSSKASDPGQGSPLVKSKVYDVINHPHLNSTTFKEIGINSPYSDGYLCLPDCIRSSKNPTPPNATWVPCWRQPSKVRCLTPPLIRWSAVSYIHTPTPTPTVQTSNECPKLIPTQQARSFKELTVWYRKLPNHYKEDRKQLLWKTLIRYYSEITERGRRN